MRLTTYVLGIAFNSSRTRAVFIRKRRPDWQCGRLNGVGGKCGYDEHPLDAMVREFEEEAGVVTGSSDWHRFAVKTGDDYAIEYFTTDVMAAYGCARTASDEEIEKWPVNLLCGAGGVPMLEIVVALADLSYADRSLSAWFTDKGKDKAYGNQG